MYIVFDFCTKLASPYLLPSRHLSLAHCFAAPTHLSHTTLAALYIISVDVCVCVWHCRLSNSSIKKWHSGRLTMADIVYCVRWMRTIFVRFPCNLRILQSENVLHALECLKWTGWQCSQKKWQRKRLDKSSQSFGAFCSYACLHGFSPRVSHTHTRARP